MALDTKEVYSILNDLVETCKDGEKGYQKAAQDAKNPSLQTLFTTYSAQRAKFASELQGCVTKLGGSPETSGSASGAMHRGWIDVKSAVTGRDDNAIVAECERGEDVAKKAYQKALEKDLPSEIRSVVETQSREVQQAHDKIRSLEMRTGGTV